MARLLRSQLNQIRAWVRQGRTDAWIAHQLDVSTSELRDFRRRHDLTAGEEAAADEDLRDEIEAEIEAATLADEETEEPEEAEEPSAEEADEPPAEEPEDAPREEAETEAEEAGAKPAERADDGERPRRRRRRRGGRGRRRGKAIEATFDHGEDEGYGLWLDPAVKDHPAYAEHWKGQRAVEVTIEPDRITIRRSGE